MQYTKVVYFATKFRRWKLDCGLYAVLSYIVLGGTICKITVYSSLGDFLEVLDISRAFFFQGATWVALELYGLTCRSLIFYFDGRMETPWIQHNFLFILDDKIRYTGKGCMVEWVIMYKKSVSNIFMSWFLFHGYVFPYSML